MEKTEQILRVIELLKSGEFDLCYQLCKGLDITTEDIVEEWLKQADRNNPLISLLFPMVDSIISDHQHSLEFLYYKPNVDYPLEFTTFGVFPEMANYGTKV